MKTLSYKALIGLMGIILLFESSCKEEEDKNDNNTTQVSAPIPDFPGAEGVLVALISASYIDIPIVGQQLTEVDGAIGTFADGTGGFRDAGSISVNDYLLTQQSDNSYAAISTSGTTDLSLSEGLSVEWTVTGSASVQSFSINTTNVMPGVFNWLSEPTSIDLDNDVTLSIDQTSSNATAIIWILGDTEGNTVQKETAGNATSVTFTSSELASLQPGDNCLVIVAPYNYEVYNNNGEDIYIVNKVYLNSFTTFE